MSPLVIVLVAAVTLVCVDGLVVQSRTSHLDDDWNTFERSASSTAEEAEGDDCPDDESAGTGVMATVLTLSQDCKVPARRMCDGWKDCDSGVDEDPDVCKGTPCPGNVQHRCPEGSPNAHRCLLPCWLCDGYSECGGLAWDESDQANCPVAQCDGEMETKCKTTNLCVRNRYFCDGLDDCGDGSDEINCGKFYGPMEKIAAKLSDIPTQDILALKDILERRLNY